MSLDVKLGREGPTPKDAATLLCVRDGASSIEILCVERAKASGFLGGAVVFPGGKLDAGDRDPRVRSGASAPRAPATAIAIDQETLAALAVAACRECFEEAGLLFAIGSAPDDATRRAMRSALAGNAAFADVLAERAVTLDLGRLVPFARWTTPAQESRRFDTRFYLAEAPPRQDPLHDAHETTSAFWAAPQAVLDRFARGEVQLFPPTHRSLEVLAGARSVGDALAIAERACLDVICPELVSQGDTLALVLPGDPEHSIAEARVTGRSRYVLRGEQWLPEPAPSR